MTSEQREQRKQALLELLRVALSVLPPDQSRPANQAHVEAVTIYDYAMKLPADAIPEKRPLRFLVQDIIRHFRPAQAPVESESWFSRWMAEYERAIDESVEQENEQDRDDEVE